MTPPDPPKPTIADEIRTGLANLERGLAIVLERLERLEDGLHRLIEDTPK